jgi:hypothetical protein
MACTLPSEIRALAAVPRTTVSSGCKIVSNSEDALFGFIPCPPEEMRARAARATGRSITLDQYSLARNIATEIGSGTIGEKVAMALSTIGRAALGSSGTTVTEVVLRNTNCSFGRGSRCLYGSIHAAGNVDTAPFGRFTASTQDPTLQDLAIAEFVLDGGGGAPLSLSNFARGADDQWSPLSSRRGDRAAAVQTGLDKIGGEALQGDFWVGPICGVDPVKIQLFKRRGELKGTPEGSALVAQLRRAYAANASLPGALGPDFTQSGGGWLMLLAAGASYGTYRFIQYQRAKMR